MTPADKLRYLEEFAQIFAPAQPPHGWERLLDELPSASATDLTGAIGHSPDVGTVSEETHRQQNNGAGITVSPLRKRMVTGSAYRAQP